MQKVFSDLFTTAPPPELKMVSASASLTPMGNDEAHSKGVITIVLG
ncbi:MAG: hypothetical protein WBG55_14530 [Pseudoalteromonas rhizosphaerae]